MSGSIGIKSGASLTQLSDNKVVDHVQESLSTTKEPPAPSDSLPKYSISHSRQQQILKDWKVTSAAMPDGLMLSDIQDELEQWIDNAPSDAERQGRIATHKDILDCFHNTSSELNLNGRSLTSLPVCIGRLAWLRSLDLSDNPLQEFPVSQLLELENLQTLLLSMNEDNKGIPIRSSHERIGEKGYKLVFFNQGNDHAKTVEFPHSEDTALYTTDLEPCLALMVIQNHRAIGIHLDSLAGGASGMGVSSIGLALNRRITADEKDTRIFLVGANTLGSAGNVRGVLKFLQTKGLERYVKMASLGNGHTSAILDLKNKAAYVGKG